MKIKVDIGVAVFGGQASQWWTSLIASLMNEQAGGLIQIGQIIAVASSLADHNKNGVLSSQMYPATYKRRIHSTDHNRVEISKRFMDGTADYLMFLDDDTVHPAGTISQLVSLRREIAAGLYYNPKEPFNPIAYMKLPDGLYQPIDSWSHGALIQVDAVGMGCTLIHRTVFESIQDEHQVFIRPTGTPVAIHKSKIFGNLSNVFTGRPDEFVSDGVLHSRVTPIELDDDRMYPFFASEFGRTEDLHFCELAANVGIKPWLDTSINCQHIKSKAFTREDYKREHPAIG